MAEFNIPSILSILLRRKRMLLVSGIATACLAFAVARILPLQYSSEGSLIIENLAIATEDVTTASASIITNVLTQVDVLESSGLIRRTMHDLNLTNTTALAAMRLPAAVIAHLDDAQNYLASFMRSIEGRPPPNAETDKLIAYVRKHLRVETKTNSSVISLRFAASTPDNAAMVVNGIMGTYLSTVGSARDARIANADQWIAQQMTMQRQDVEAAEQRVTQFMQSHNLAEVQGSLTAAIQLSKDQAQLSLARENLARQQASLDTITHGGSVAEETLASRTIQELKNDEAKLIEQIASAAFGRTSLQAGAGAEGARLALTDIRAQISSETKLIVDSMSRAVQVSLAHVRALEATVHADSELAQVSAVAGSTLKQLTGDLEAKRELSVAFLTQAAKVRLTAEQAPVARILFQAVPPQQPISYGAISLLLGFLVGLAGAAGTVVLRNHMRTKIDSTDEIAAGTDLPVLMVMHNEAGNDQSAARHWSLHVNLSEIDT